jgi:hypothetical protein
MRKAGTLGACRLFMFALLAVPIAATAPRHATITALSGDDAQAALAIARNAALDAELFLQSRKLSLAGLAIGMGVARVALGFFDRLRTMEGDGEPAAENVVALHLHFGFAGARKAVPNRDQPLDQLVERGAIFDFDKIFDKSIHDTLP